MTDEETDAGVGRLVRRYADTNKKVACLTDRIQKQSGAVTQAGSNMKLDRRLYGSLLSAWDVVDWEALGKDMESLREQVAERTHRRPFERCRSWRLDQMRPMLDPARDLAGATPETLARALFRRVEPLRPRPTGKTIVRDEVTVKKVATDKPGHRVPHLRKRS